MIVECNYPEVAIAGEPLHRHKDGTYWWYDETWADEYGPYETEKIARAELKRYCREVLG